jgi:kynureninase
MVDITSQAYASGLDAKDVLSSFREEFIFPKDMFGQEKVYLNGNSLGLQPKRCSAYVQQVLSDWATFGVEGHYKATPAWTHYHEILTDQMADVVGALPDEVVVMNSLTVNIHLLMVSFYRPTAKRYKILIEKAAFPSDRYAVQSQLSFHGFDANEGLIEVGPRKGESAIRPEDIYETIEKHGHEIALIWIGNVNYYTGQAFDMKQIAMLGHAKGCVVGFDLAHGAGNLNCNLHDSGVDFAAWCTYKYMNSGPGGLSGIFVHERHKYNFDLPRFTGWWGHDKSRRFLMEPEFVPLPGAEGWQMSNPPILPMASLKASLDVFSEAGMDRLYAKRTVLSQYLLDLLNTLPQDKIQVVTPANPESHGAQISIRLMDKSKDLFFYLAEKGIVTDWREPDVIRVAPVPLYNCFMDVWTFYRAVSDYLKNRKP